MFELRLKAALMSLGLDVLLLRPEDFEEPISQARVLASRPHKASSHDLAEDLEEQASQARGRESSRSHKTSGVELTELEMAQKALSPEECASVRIPYYLIPVLLLN